MASPPSKRPRTILGRWKQRQNIMYFSYPLKVLIGFALASLLSRRLFHVNTWSSDCPGCLPGRTHAVQNICEGYDGILFISDNIPSAATGTFFFQSIVDQLLYAKKYNLYPFIWMNYLKPTDPCFDVVVHGQSIIGTYRHKFGSIDSVHRYKEIKECQHDPTAPIFPKDGKGDMVEFDLAGNGVWQSYFQPYPIPFVDESCKEKPAFEFNFDQVFPGLHYCWDDGIRGWPFEFLPKALLPQGQNKTIKEWLSDHRQRASQTVQEHFHLQPHLAAKVEKINPAQSGKCLAVHIRMTDKGHGRKKRGVEAYLPYVEAFARRTNSKKNKVYLATDDSRVIDNLLNASSVLQRSIFMMQPDTLQSDSKTSTFKAFKNEKHRLNTETLVDIYAMSKCSYLVHGYSAVAESAVYINPSLDSHSVNIDDPELMDADAFGALISKTL